MTLSLLTMETCACCMLIGTRALTCHVLWLSVTGNFPLTYCKCYLIKEGGHIYKLNAYVHEDMFCANTSACYHAVTCADTHTHLNPPTHRHCSPDNRHTHTHTHTHTGLMVYSVWRASPVSLSLRYQADSGVAGMSSISVTGTSLCDSNSQPSSTAARLSHSNTIPTAHNSNPLQRAHCSSIYCITVYNKKVTQVQYFCYKAFKARTVFLLSFLSLCPLYCPIKWWCPNEKLLCRIIKQTGPFKAAMSTAFIVFFFFFSLGPPSKVPFCFHPCGRRPTLWKAWGQPTEASQVL